MPISRLQLLTFGSLCLLVAVAHASGRKSVLENLENVKTSSLEKLKKHENTNSLDRTVLNAEKLANDVLLEVLRLNQNLTDSEAELEEAKSEKSRVELELTSVESTITAKQRELNKTLSGIDEMRKHVAKSEQQYQRAKKERLEDLETQKDLKELISNLREKIEDARSKVSQLSDARLEHWVRAKIDSLGEYLGSPDSTEMMSDVLDRVEKFSEEASQGLQYISKEVDNSTRSPTLSFFVTGALIVVPLLCMYFVLKRLLLMINLRGIILLMNLALLSYFLLCLILAGGHVNVADLAPSYRRSVVGVQLFLSFLCPALGILIFISAAYGVTRHEKICYSVQFINLLVILGLISDFWKSDAIQLYAPPSHQVIWYLAVCISFSASITLTLSSRKIGAQEVLAKDVQTLVTAGSGVLGLSSRSLPGPGAKSK